MCRDILSLLGDETTAGDKNISTYPSFALYLKGSSMKRIL